MLKKNNYENNTEGHYPGLQMGQCFWCELDWYDKPRHDRRSRAPDGVVSTAADCLVLRVGGGQCK